ncbi:MAG: hypothetical protein J1E85_00235 [Ruminococcus sp.]|nr:hypothetical protein [Ruminococcus sp.]
MNLMQIYFEISKNKTDEYYIELSKNEVLVIPILIEIAQDGTYSERKRSASILEKISENQPYQMAVFAHYIIKAISDHRDFSSWCLWKCIENIFDLLDVSVVEDEFIKALNSNILGEYSIACDCAEKYILNYPKSKNKIIDILKNVHDRDFIVEGRVSEICGEIAAEKALLLLDKLNIS